MASEVIQGLSMTVLRDWVNAVCKFSVVIITRKEAFLVAPVSFPMWGYEVSVDREVEPEDSRSRGAEPDSRQERTPEEEQEPVEKDLEL